MTLNQIIKVLQLISESHKQLRHFYFGDAAEWTKCKDLEYPSAYLQLTGNVRLVSGGKEVSFSLYLSDLILQTPEDVNEPALDANSIEAISDMLQVGEDIDAAIQNPNLDWMVQGDVTLAPFDPEPVNSDYVAGCRMDFTLFVPYARNRCQIPIREVGLLAEGGAYIITEDGKKIIAE